MYGAGFTKHNTNTGFVNKNLHRITPQVIQPEYFFGFFHSCYCAIVNSSFLLQILLKFKTHLQQVFSAHSFYESQGNWLEADIQGVGNLFTDPQVLSSDYCFGDGDLGLCGMALFFDTFRHNTVTSALGIPFFPLLDRTWASFRIWRRHFPSTRKWFFY